nr:glycerophosphodiester phosphodiesterase [Anaerolineae bacterium]
MTQLPLADFYANRILNFAHRGARMQAPENTLEAFFGAAAAGADGVELDVQLTADGSPVVIHDLSVARTTNGAGRVADLSLAELKELDAGSWFSPAFTGAIIPTLDEVFEAVGQSLLINIEMKAFDILKPQIAERLIRTVVSVIERHNMEKRVICSSFNPLLLRKMRQMAPGIPLGFIHTPELFTPLSWRAIPAMLIGKHQARHPRYTLVDELYVQWAHQKGYRINVWTVNEEKTIRQMLDLGVDMIMSDYPDLVHGIQNR